MEVGYRVTLLIQRVSDSKDSNSTGTEAKASSYLSSSQCEV